MTYSVLKLQLIWPPTFFFFFFCGLSRLGLLADFINVVPAFKRSLLSNKREVDQMLVSLLKTT